MKSVAKVSIHKMSITDKVNIFFISLNFNDLFFASLTEDKFNS